MYTIKQSTALTVPFFVHNAAGDAVTGLTSAQFTKRISKNGAVFAAMTVVVTELELGWYSIPLSTVHSNTLGILTLIFDPTVGQGKQVNLQWRVEARLADDLCFPTVSGNSLDVTGTGAAGIDWGNVEGQATSVTLSATTMNLVNTTTANTDMRGTDSALLAASAPTNFGDLAITVTTGLVSVGTNNDKTGYSLTQVFPTNFADLAITLTTGQVTVGTNNDKTGYSLTQVFPTNFADLAIRVTTGEVTANMTEISGDAPAADNLETMLDGTGGNVLSLGQLNIVASGGNSAIVATGAGAGHGALFTGGGTSGAGFRLLGGAPDGRGIHIGGAGTGEGMRVVGGPSNGTGINAFGNGTGHGMHLESISTGNGLDVLGGIAGGDGIRTTGTVGGHGFSCIGGTAAGDGIRAQRGGTGVDIRGDITGTLTGLNSNNIAEPGQGATSHFIPLQDKIGFIYKFLRNQLTVTATEIDLFSDGAGQVDQKSTISDDGTTFTRGEFVSGP